MTNQPNMLFFKTQCLLQMLHTTMSVINCKSNFTFLFVQLKKTTNWRDYLWDCRGNSTITHFEGNPCVSSNNQKQKNCSHNLLSVRPKSSSWIAVISCHDCQLTSSAPTSDCRSIYENQDKELSESLELFNLVLLWIWMAFQSTHAMETY
jgi:hypothetical protein